MSVVTLQESRSPSERYARRFDARWRARATSTGRARRAALERFAAARIPDAAAAKTGSTPTCAGSKRARFAPADERSGARSEPRWIADAGTRVVLVDGHCMPDAVLDRARSFPA